MTRFVRCLVLLMVAAFAGFAAVACAGGGGESGSSGGGGGGGGTPGTIPDYAGFDSSLTLLETIDCANPPATAAFAEYPAGGSTVQTILGQSARVLSPIPNQYKYVSYTVGKNLPAGKSLQAGAAYVIKLEYPEDTSRSWYVLNRGAETARGFCTGQAVGDQVGGWVYSVPESLSLPLSGQWKEWTQYFHLHERYPGTWQPRDVDFQGTGGGTAGTNARTQTPADGFQVIVMQLDTKQAPLDAGAALGKLRLYEVTSPITLNANPLPAGLPKRHVFWREEMSDGVVSYMGDPATEWGMQNDQDWYEHKLKLMRFLGIRTFAKDLLEFGHNQGWPVSDANWWNPAGPNLVQRWSEIVTLCQSYGFDVIPYYEYYGSTGPGGIGPQKTCLAMKNSNSYTGFWWVELYNADITGATTNTLADATRLLDETLSPFKTQVDFPAIWFRARPSAMPISFRAACRAEFESDTGRTAGSASLAALSAARSATPPGQLYVDYCQWWFEERREFLLGMQSWLRSNIHSDCDVMFTWDNSEPGWPFPGSSKYIVNDDPATWSPICTTLQTTYNHWFFHKDYAPTVSGNEYYQAMRTSLMDYGADEWSHSVPWADPQNYATTDGVFLTHTMNRAFSLTETSLSGFRSQNDLACIRHYCLNEDAHAFAANEQWENTPLGYLAADVERAGPFSMLLEARAVALGDPNYLGYCSSNTWNHGFPVYARKFFANYLSLPALPSTVVAGASADPEVVVRRIQTPSHGTYFAIVNLGVTSKSVAIDLVGASGNVTHPATGTVLGSASAPLPLTLEPCELLVVRVQ